jgi:hypothetical protein
MSDATPDRRDDMLTKNTDILRQEVKVHIEADALVRGQYWRDGKGCFIGCLTHSDSPVPAAERFGLPEPLLRLAEHIFEHLPAGDAKAFFAAFPNAVACDGKDLSRVHWAFMAAELRALPKQPKHVQAVIDRVIAGMDTLASGGEWSANAAHAAARAAARAAAEAARAVAYAAYADTNAAARAAHAAADAADAAARAAEAAYADAAFVAYAAVNAARLAAIHRQRDLLLRLIEEAPVTTPTQETRDE